MRPRIMSVAVFAAAAVAFPVQQAGLHAEELALRPSATSLPDSPGAVRAAGEVLVPAVDTVPLAQPPALQAGSMAPQIARKYARTIGPGMAAEPWGAREKFLAAFSKQVSIGGLASPVFVAGWQQVRDGRPHYGTDSGAFGARIGAAYTRQSAQSFINIGLMSSLLHDDPRYYVMGPTHAVKARVIYAATRVFVTRKDDGSDTANIPLIAGVVSSQAMADVLYPDQDRKWSRIATGSLGSLASKMATQQFKEFSAEIRQRIPFLKKK